MTPKEYRKMMREVIENVYKGMSLIEAYIDVFNYPKEKVIKVFRIKDD